MAWYKKLANHLLLLFLWHNDLSGYSKNKLSILLCDVLLWYYLQSSNKNHAAVFIYTDLRILQHIFLYKLIQRKTNSWKNA